MGASSGSMAQAGMDSRTPKFMGAIAGGAQAPAAGCCLWGTLPQNCNSCVPTWVEQEVINTARPSSSMGRQTVSPLLEQTLLSLFVLHDLDGDGSISEDELIRLNVKIAQLHYGEDIDQRAVEDKFRNLFRKNLNANGKPAPYSAFRPYVLRVLDGLDPDLATQEMILEQLCQEAQLARTVLQQQQQQQPFQQGLKASMGMKWCCVRGSPNPLGCAMPSAQTCA